MWDAVPAVSLIEDSHHIQVLVTYLFDHKILRLGTMNFVKLVVPLLKGSSHWSEHGWFNTRACPCVILEGCSHFRSFIQRRMHENTKCLEVPHPGQLICGWLLCGLRWHISLVIIICIYWIRSISVGKNGFAWHISRLLKRQRMDYNLKIITSGAPKLDILRGPIVVDHQFDRHRRDIPLEGPPQEGLCTGATEGECSSAWLVGAALSTCNGWVVQSPLRRPQRIRSSTNERAKSRDIMTQLTQINSYQLYSLYPVVLIGSIMLLMDQPASNRGVLSCTFSIFLLLCASFINYRSSVKVFFHE